MLLGSLIIFAALSVGSRTLYDQAEQRLLEESTGEASQVLTVAVGSLKSPIESAATVAHITDGNPDAFRAAMTDQVGPAPRSFTSAALYRLGQPDPVAVLGSTVALTADGPTSAAGVAETAAKSDGDFVVVDLLSSGRRLGYAAVDSAADPRFLVYAERQLGPDPNVRTRTDEPFARLNYAIYLNDERPEQLLSSSLPDSELPVSGRRARSSWSVLPWV